jgi:hypothetical protein
MNPIFLGAFCHYQFEIAVIGDTGISRRPGNHRVRVVWVICRSSEHSGLRSDVRPLCPSLKVGS